jgi:uncharacterized SAM-binding protein YcdF (DUF218 family)
MSKRTVIMWLLIGLIIAVIINLAYQFISLRTGNHLTTVDRADVIVILGAAVWPGGQPSLVLRDRTLRAAELFHQGIAAKIICTGGVGDNPPAEAEVEKRLLVEAGVPDSAIILETASTSTHEQARAIKAMGDQQGFHSLALVTSFYHERRAIQFFRSAGISDIQDARCVHTQFVDINYWVARESLYLTVVNFWQWGLAGLGIGSLLILWRARGRRRPARLEPTVET